MNLLRITILACLIGTPTFAQTPDTTVRNALIAEAQSYQADLQNGNWARAIQEVPPGLLAEIAAAQDTSVDELRDTLTETFKETVRSREIQSFDLELDRMTLGETPVGRGYALIPSTIVILMDDTVTITATDPILLMQVDDEVYIMVLDSPGTIGALTAAYPDFNGLDLLQ